MGGGGIRCGLKGETDAIIVRGESPLFRRVGSCLDTLCIHM
jgi:hypothetical protein